MSARTLSPVGAGSFINIRMHMFLSAVNTPPRLRQLAVLAIVCTTASGLAVLSHAPAQAAQLVMLEQPGCPWCKRFNEEIAPAYARTDEGSRAPLRRVDITGPWPADLANIRKERLTPTFVLMDEGVEIDRLRGYPGDDFFWGLLDDMLAKLPDGTAPQHVRSSP